MNIARVTVAAVICGLLAGCGTTTTSQVTAGKKIAFLVPDGSARFESQDWPMFQAKVQSVCAGCALMYRNAGGDPATQMQQAQAALTAGAAVIVLDPVDATGAAAIVSAAARRHVPVIAYDHLVLNSASIAYFVSFDDAKVGALQGAALLQAMHSSSTPSVVMMNGDPDDHEAAQLKKAAHATLDGKVTVAKEYDTPAASAQNAQLEMAQALSALQNKLDGVYAATDNVAGGAVAAMKAAGLKVLPPVTGGDADLAAVQRIIAGDQYMTVYRPVKQEAEGAAVIAYDLAFGVPVTQATTGGVTVDNGARQVPAVLVEPLAVTRKDLVTTVLADGFWTRAQLCTAAYASACKTAGLS